MINKKVMTKKKNFDEQTNKIFVIIYNFVIQASLMLVFSINILADITLMGKITKKKYYKSQKLTKFTLN